MTLTLRDIPHELDAALQREALHRGGTVDQVALEVLRAGLGLRTAGAAQAPNLPASIRERFTALGGIDLPEAIREPLRDRESCRSF